MLLSRAHQRLGSRGSDRLRRFSRWLEGQPAFDFVVDGPNVGYANQNFEGGRFSFAQAPAAQLGRRGEGRGGGGDRFGRGAALAVRQAPSRRPVVV